MMISTERLTIRRIIPEDWESVKRLWDDIKETEYACFDRPNDTDPDIVRRRIEKWASFENSMEHMFYAVLLKGSFIGYVAFNRRDSGYEIGYCFHSEFHGKGYAKECISALIRAIRNIQPDVTITAGTALKNIPSVNLLRTLGFRQIGSEQVSFYTDTDGNAVCFDGGIFENAIKNKDGKLLPR